jgi:hypothetical protein
MPDTITVVVPNIDPDLLYLQKQELDALLTRVDPVEFEQLPGVSNLLGFMLDECEKANWKHPEATP